MRLAGWMLALLFALQPAVRLACELTCFTPAQAASQPAEHHCRQSPGAQPADTAALQASSAQTCEHDAILIPAAAHKRLALAPQLALHPAGAVDPVAASTRSAISMSTHAPAPGDVIGTSVLRI